MPIFLQKRRLRSHEREEIGIQLLSRLKKGKYTNESLDVLNKKKKGKRDAKKIGTLQSLTFFFIYLLSATMMIWFLLCMCLVTTQAQKLITFGTGLSSQRLFLAEVKKILIKFIIQQWLILIYFRLKFSIIHSLLVQHLVS